MNSFVRRVFKSSSEDNKKKKGTSSELKQGATPAEDSARVNAVPDNSEQRKQQRKQQQEVDDILDAVIIGAGWSGCGAGRTFLKLQQQKRAGRWNGRTKEFRFCILEGHSEIGGRSRTLSPISEEYPESLLELGSQWIQGASRRNKIFRLALKHDMILHYDRGAHDWYSRRTAVWRDRLDDSNTTTSSLQRQTDRLSDRKVERLKHELLYDDNGFYPYLTRYPAKQRRVWIMDHRNDKEKIKESPPSVSVNDAMEDYCHLRKLSPQQRQYLKWLVEVDLTQEYAGSLEDIDAEWWDHDKEYPGGDAHFGFSANNAHRGSRKGGYFGLIRQYAEPLLQSNLIHCNCMVKSIDYSRDPIVIKYTKANPNTETEIEDPPTLLEIRARSVLCTVPLGVLKAGIIRFTPPLPGPKMDAIQKLGVGTYNKVVLVWKPEQRHLLPWLYPLDQTRKKWRRKVKLTITGYASKETGRPTNRTWMERVCLPGEPQGPWTECYIPHTHQTASSPIMLYFFLAGRLAQQMETFSNGEIQEQAMAALRDWFGSDIPDPDKVIASRWGQDALARGSYSFYQVGSSPADRTTLAAPVNGRLFFAGEANHVKYYATTHGALMTGKTTAKLMWKTVTKQQKKEEVF